MHGKQRRCQIFYIFIRFTSNMSAIINGLPDETILLAESVIRREHANNVMRATIYCIVDHYLCISITFTHVHNYGL